MLALYRGLRAEDEEWHARARAMVEDEWGFPAGTQWLVRKGSFGSNATMMGVAAIPGEQPPKGWRVLKDTDGWVPHLVTKIGKKIKGQLATIQPPPSLLGRLPGMTGFAIVGNRIISPALFVHEDAMYVHWSARCADEDWNPEIWTEIPMSAYYLAKEAYDASKEPDAAA